MNTPQSNNKEVLFPKEYNLLSITSPSSYITYASKEFCEISGFNSNELLSQPHNIVRHQDMPSDAFKNMWSHLQDKKSWMGLVKNRCKNGNYYWVDAFVSPIINDNKIKEYQSVRLCPSREHVKNAENVYKQIKNGKKPLKLSLPRTRLWQRFMLTLLPTFTVSAIVNQFSPLLSLIAMSGLSLISIFVLTRRLEALSKKARDIFDNPLMELVYTNNVDDLAEIELAFKMRQSEINAVVGRIQDSNKEIESLATSSTNNCQNTVNNISIQSKETIEVANAIQEMNASVSDIAASVQATASVTEDAHKITSEGMLAVTETVTSIEELSVKLTNASEVISTLEEHGNTIGSVLTVIQSLAEQTNLLALNAAIEAARAGEQGRGFAVVADEVRNLAQRSQGSTKEIQEIISLIQVSTQDAVRAMNDGKELSEVCVKNSNQSGNKLRESLDQVTNISAQNTQISVAVEQMVKVADEMNINIQLINNVCLETNSIANGTMEQCQTLSKTIHSQGDLVSQFRTLN